MAPELPPLPSLAAFSSHLDALVASPSPPPAMYVHVPGDSHTLAKTLRATLERATAATAPSPPSATPPVDSLLPKVAYIDLARVHSVKAAFDDILGQLSGWDTAGRGAWDDRDAGIRAWDGSMHGLTVVRDKKRARHAIGGRATKRARTARQEGADWEAQEAAEGQEDGSDDDEPRWTLEWDRSAPADTDKPNLAPLRNTVDAFHYSLRAVFSVSGPPAATATSALDAGVDLRPPAQPQPARRFIVIEHGELLSELAGGASTASGAARETGVGVTFASTIYRLAQITGLPITTITVSRLRWHKARESMVGLPSPELLSFDDISSADIVALLTSRFASSPAAQSAAGDALTHAQLVELFRSLAYVVQTTFGKAVTEVDEVAFLCAKFWPRWKEVRDRGNPPIAPTDAARLSIALKGDFAAELERLFLPRQTLAAVSTAAGGGASATSATRSAPHGFTGTIAPPPKQPTFLDSPSKSAASSSAVTNGGAAGDFFASAASTAFPSPARPGASTSAASDPFAAPIPPSRTTSASSSSAAAASASAARVSSSTTLAKSLPVAARYVLLAAYFAAHNPPRSDVRMFVRVDETEGVARKGKKARKARAGKAGASPGKKSAAALSGGKPFAVERLVALFDAIVDARLEYALGTPAVLALVQTLVQLRLLGRASAADKVLDGVKLRCAIEREEAEALALSVGWREWKERLVGEDD